jgi:HAD superfamily hydrolase (TIGR01458 family)
MFDSMKKKSFLIDINGVLYFGNQPVLGAIETISFLRKEGYNFRLVTNATRSSRKSLCRKLSSMGFDIKPEEIFSAPIATISRIKRSGKNRVFLLSKGDVSKDFKDAGLILTETRPDFVVIGDAGENFSFRNMNKAFRLVLGGAKLIAMEKDLFWATEEGKTLSAGPFVAGLEYATGKSAEVIGKPSKEFFSLALRDMDAKAEDSVLIGDDIHSDVAGAQGAGMKAYLVKTGKFDSNLFRKSNIKPDKVIKSIADIREFL